MQKDWKLINKLDGFNKYQIDHLKDYINDLDKLNLMMMDGEESFIILKDLEENTTKLKDLKLQSILRLLGDFYRLNWKVRLESKGLFLLKDENIKDDKKKRELYRKSYSFQRFDQLNRITTREFVQKMEKLRNYNDSKVSILSLVRDGQDLSKKINGTLSLDEMKIYPDIIHPYIQAVGDTADKKTCEHTGLKLTDIYRYFRYTWITPSNSIPGRSMTFLVRDAASQTHPIIGIFALSSAAPQLTKRDESIGWSNEKFIEKIKSKPTKSTINLILKQIDDLIDAIRVDDFFSENLIKPVDLRVLNQQAVNNIEAKAKHWKKLWQDSPEQKKALKDPLLASETYLYKSKRGNELAFLLRSKFSLETHRNSKKEIKNFLNSKVNVTMLNGIAKRIRSRKLGVNIADLTVCGAIPPYNKLIGGKLVSSLAVSPETITLYKKKYKNFESVIASNMAGKSVIKEADLVYISTTSLFGIRPGQYDNISIPFDSYRPSNKKSLKYKYLGKLVGGGSMHFSKETTGVMGRYMRSESVSKVNYVFGEGASPKLRAIRDGLQKLGFRGEDTIYHEMPKTLYGVNLIENLTDYLMGFNKRPKYVYDLANPSLATKEISDWWSKRWATKRIQRDVPKILEDLDKDNLSFPIRHGGKVLMPEIQDKQIAINFED